MSAPGLVVNILSSVADRHCLETTSLRVSGRWRGTAGVWLYLGMSMSAPYLAPKGVARRRRLHHGHPRNRTFLGQVPERRQRAFGRINFLISPGSV